MKKHFLLALTLVSISSQAMAFFGLADCDPSEQDCSNTQVVEKADDSIYPYKPFQTDHIRSRLEILTEDKNFIWSIKELDKRGIQSATTQTQPWGGPFWPLNQGLIANTYHNKDYKTFIFSFPEHLSWRENLRDFYRLSGKYKYTDDMSEYELSRLAPAEKYDLILGDKEFDLTHRLWDYAEKWGAQKRWAFVSKVHMEGEYIFPRVSRTMALWEGICHGWAVAAGHTPRPKNTVYVTLPNGKKVPFYPDDIKGLISLTWANSVIQNKVMFEGSRCNKKAPRKDAFGRYIDTTIDRNDSTLQPRCADVHPAIFHVAIMNILGIQKRSFVMDVKPEAAIANQPVAGYSFRYFDPHSGRYGTYEEAMWNMKEYENYDWFWESRNKDATEIVGVHMEVSYIDWQHPSGAETNSEADDRIKKTKFFYDLEIDAKGNIIGGQWRSDRKVKKVFNPKPHHPDFFWVVPKNYADSFMPVSGLPEWKTKDSVTLDVVPKEYLPVALNAHNFVFEESAKFFGQNPKCPVFPAEGGEMRMVDCEFRYPKPQPLLQIVNKLIELSSK